MRKIAVVNMKGGMGKTTTAIHLAAGLAGRGQRVLLVDTDPQGNVGHSLHVHPALTIQDLMAGTSQLNEVIVPQVRKGLDVIASNTLSFGLERQLAAETQRETILSRRLRGLRGYDVVVVDTSPAMNLLTFNALLFAEEVVIPVGMDLMAIIGARQTLNGVREVQELWPDGSSWPGGCLPSPPCTRLFLSARRGRIRTVDPTRLRRRYDVGGKIKRRLGFFSTCHELLPPAGLRFLR